VVAFSACLLLALMILGLSQAPAAAADGRPADLTPGVTGTQLETPPDQALEAWSTSDFLAAQPVEPPADPSSAFDLPDLSGARTSAGEGPFVPFDVEREPLRTHGKIFFKLGGERFVCSGTVVDSRGRNIVFTAGHCVYDTDSGEYVDELVFVPAYQGGASDPEDQGGASDPEPFGVWAATAVFTSRGFVENGALSQDIGAVVLDRRIQDTVGARRIAFDLKPAGRKYTIYGYPADPDPPYDGESMIGCRSSFRFRDPNQGTPLPVAAGPCDMQGGSSGGGWITGTGAGYLNSVVSYGYCDAAAELCGLVFGPYFSGQAKDIYTYPAVGGSISPTVGIIAGPRGRIRQRWANFRFTGSGSTPVGYRCRLDRRPYVRCGSRVGLRRLKPGMHVLRVRSVDQTGRLSAKVAVRRFGVARPGR
jgi:hypothetical protein